MRILFFTLILGLTLAACTQNSSNQTPTASTSATSTPAPTQAVTPSPTEIASPSPTPAITKRPMNSPKPTVSASAKSEVQSYSTNTSNSTTNIDVTSNGNNIKVISENGKKYALKNGVKIELDSNGCYNEEKDGSKTHICVN